MNYIFLLLIPDSRKRPLTESLLYKKIIKFLESEGMEEFFDIAFITINEGVVDAHNQCHSEPKAKNPLVLPPTRFRSGRNWLKKEDIEKMANSIVSSLRARAERGRGNLQPIAYARGSYLEAVRLANRKILHENSVEKIRHPERSGAESKDLPRLLPDNSPIIELFTDDELAQLKKKGIMWMKVGLRMNTPFIIFRMKIRFMVMDVKENGKQLKLF